METYGIVVGVLIAVAVGFAALWSLIGAILRSLGWARIAGAYPAGMGAPPAGARAFESARIGKARYRGFLTVGADAAGLYVALSAPLFPGHAAFRVPWTEFSAAPEAGPFGVRLVRLRLRQTPDDTILLRADLAERLAAAPGARWPAAR